MVNREIKYRGFYKGKMYQVGEIRFEAKEVCLWNGKGSTFNFIGTSKVELMQFTGFKDCNGIEIFEGDNLIDVDVTLDEGVKREDCKQQVFWCEKEGCWKLDNTFSQNKKEGWYLGKDLKDFRFKVSGNVYENAL